MTRACRARQRHGRRRAEARSRWEDARDEYEKALKFKPGDAAAQSGLDRSRGARRHSQAEGQKLLPPGPLQQRLPLQPPSATVRTSCAMPRMGLRRSTSGCRGCQAAEAAEALIQAERRAAEAAERQAAEDAAAAQEAQAEADRQASEEEAAAAERQAQRAADAEARQAQLDADAAAQQAALDADREARESRQREWKQSKRHVKLRARAPRARPRHGLRTSLSAPARQKTRPGVLPSGFGFRAACDGCGSGRCQG